MSLRDLYVGISFNDKASKAIDKVDKSMDNAAGGAENLGSKTDTSSKKMGFLGEAGVKAGGLIATAFTGAVAGIVALVGEQDKAMSGIAAKTGLTGDELKSLQDVSKNVFVSGMGTSIEQVSNDITNMRSALTGLNDQELERFGKNAINISEQWGQGTDSIVWAVKNMTGNFKDLSEQDALDLITVGFQETGDYAGDLLETFREYSPYFADMGLSAEQFTSILINGAKKGAWNLDKVGDAVKEIGIRAIDGSDGTTDAFKELGFNAEDMSQKFSQGGDVANQAFYATIAGLAAMDDEVKRNQVGVSLFGTQWEDVKEEVILSMADSKDAVLDFAGKSDEATKTATDNIQTNLVSAWRDFKTEFSSIFQTEEGQDLMSGISAGIEKALGLVKTFTSTIINNWGTISNVVIGLGVAFGTFTAIMGGLKVIGVINTLMIAYRSGTLLATLAQYGLNTAMLASPLTWVAVAIAAVVAAGVLLYKNWDTVKATAQTLWDKLKVVWSAIEDGFTAAWNSIKSAGETAMNSVIGGINALIEKINMVPGVEVPVIAKVDWSQTEEPKKGKKKAKADGSHAVGLARVPFDGYMAETHEDEAILTAKQSNALRSAGILKENGDGTPTVNMQNAGERSTVNPTGNATAARPSLTISQLIIQGTGNVPQDIKRMIEQAHNEYWESFERRNPQITVL